MKLKNILFTFALLIFISQNITAQYDIEDETTEIEEEDLNQLTFKERLYFGGNLGFSFGIYTQINVSPIIGYQITEGFSSGIGLKYNYFSFNGSPSYSSSIYGGSVFARHSIVENLYAYTEFEMLNLGFYGTTTRKWVPIGLIGAGYNFRPFQIMALYDLIGDKNNPYVSPLGNQSRIYLRFGVIFNL